MCFIEKKNCCNPNMDGICNYLTASTLLKTFTFIFDASIQISTDLNTQLIIPNHGGSSRATPQNSCHLLVQIGVKNEILHV